MFEKSTFTITPFSGKPGREWETFDDALMNSTAGKVDERGWSYADHLMGVDEGSPGGPVMLAANTTEGRKARQLLRKRQKGSFSFLAHHQADPDIVVQLKRMHFQDGRAAYQYMDGAYRTPIDNIALKQMDKDFDALDLLETVGVNEHTVTLIVKVMRVLNATRPIANQKDETEMTEKLLEMIYTTSKHFSENATLEYNKVAGQRGPTG